MAPDTVAGLTDAALAEELEAVDCAEDSSPAMSSMSSRLHSGTELHLLPAEKDQQAEPLPVKARTIGMLILSVLAVAFVVVSELRGSWSSGGCNFHLTDSDGGAKQGIRRRALGPGHYQQQLPDGYCEAVFASALGRAVPTCAEQSEDASATGLARRRTEGALPPTTIKKWWQRWGSSVDGAVEMLMGALTTDEKLRFARGTGWAMWQAAPNFYVGSILAQCLGWASHRSTCRTRARASARRCRSSAPPSSIINTVSNISSGWAQLLSFALPSFSFRTHPPPPTHPHAGPAHLIPDSSRRLVG